MSRQSIKDESMLFGMIVLAALMTGCTGIVTGHTYTVEEINQIREIAHDVYKDAKYAKEDLGK